MTNGRGVVGAGRELLDRAWALVDAYVVTGLCLVMLLLSVLTLPDAVSAFRDEGRPGTFTAVDERCNGRAGCDWVGVFRGDDGTVFEPATSDDGALKLPNDTARGQVVSGDSAVRAAHEVPWLLLAVDGAALAYLLWWVRRRGWRDTRD